MIGKWKSKRNVLYISTEHKNGMVEYIDKKGKSKKKPLPIFKYNQFVIGVDCQDQMNSYKESEAIIQNTPTGVLE